jgi:DNA-binding response OmpR family regulator/DNA-binding CsgD family transcriptional regulator
MDKPMNARRQGATLPFHQSVLVIDDDLDNQWALSRCLEADGCRVLKALDGKSALERVHHEPPDLILAEVKMREMDGFETCRRLKNDRTLQKIPVVFMTCPADLDEKVKAFELGAVDFIAKPIQPEEVLVRVRTHLRLQGVIAHLEDQVRHINDDLSGANQAFKAILDQREMERRSIEQAMVANLKRYVYPYLDELERPRAGSEHKSYVKIIRTNIEQLIAPVSSRLGSAYLDLTPTEVKVADLIRQSKRTKSIAAKLNISPSTVEKHRNKIRKKLNILHQKVNLATYLNSLS